MSKRKQLAAMALGGVGQIGMNMMVYECDGKYIVVDAGQSFADEHNPGVDSIIPDTRFLREHQKDIEAVFITHAHEDHIGAIAYLWDDFGGAPVFASQFARMAVEDKLRELGVKPGKQQLITAKPYEPIKAGAFSVEYVPVAHSILEAFGLAIKTDYGTIVHTGDYKFDPSSPFGQDTDAKRWGEIGKDGVLAVFGDSTNIFNLKETLGEDLVAAHIEGLIKNAKQKVFFAAFASHMGRNLKVAEIAAANGRKVCFLGRTVNRMIGYAKELGYYPATLKNWVIDAEQAAGMPPEKVFIFASGTQGEGGSSLTRLGHGQEVRGLRVNPGDTVIYSSRMIPGNERPILDVVSGLYERGAHVINELTDRKTHVSGHGGRPDIQRMYKLLNPKYVVPVHGEGLHLVEHANVAKSWGYKPLRLKAGHKLVLAPGEAHVAEHTYHHGFNYVDGLNILNTEALPIKERKKMAYNGVVSAALALRKSNGQWVGDLTLSTRGLIDERLQRKMIDKAAGNAMKVLDSLFPDGFIDDQNQAREAITQSVRKSFRADRGKEPVIMVNFVEV
jgi:ribonuclease J